MTSAIEEISSEKNERLQGSSGSSNTEKKRKAREYYMGKFRLSSGYYRPLTSFKFSFGELDIFLNEEEEEVKISLLFRRYILIYQR